MTEPLIQFEDVCFSYNNGDEVLHNISFDVPERSLVAMVGPNGGGKSTLLRLTLGLYKPRYGRISVFGRPPQKVRHRIGYVPQHLQFDQDFPVTVREVVLMGRAERHWIGPYRRRDHDATDRALVQVGMKDLQSRPFSKLSGGQRQRTLIAQALVTEPELLLLDEPTANVDAVVEHELYELLHKLNERLTIVIVSHNINVVTRYASHIACVNHTATVHKMGDVTEEHLHFMYESNKAILQHDPNCQVIDPTHALLSPHRGEHTHEHHHHS